MHAIVKSTLGALGVMALAVPATAQTSKDPVLTAKIDDGLGTGNFTAVIQPAEGTMCYMLNVATYEPPIAAHIHKGAKGTNGDVVVPLATPADGASGDCISVAPDVAKAMVADPGDYYVNVHTKSFPAGAVRGQLTGAG